MKDEPLLTKPNPSSTASDLLLGINQRLLKITLTSFSKFSTMSISTKHHYSLCILLSTPGEFKIDFSLLQRKRSESQQRRECYVGLTLTSEWWYCSRFCPGNLYLCPSPSADTYPFTLLSCLSTAPASSSYRQKANRHSSFFLILMQNYNIRKQCKEINPSPNF